jgi:acetyl esterase
MPVNLSDLKLFAELERRAASAPPPSSAAPTLAEFCAMTALFDEFTGQAMDVPFEDVNIPARDGYLLKTRIYNPQLDASSPVFILFPGCGYVLDLFEVNAITASRIAKYSGVKVIIVQFRLCPEVAMPTPVCDAYDAVKYIAQHHQEFKIDPDQIIIGGFSSGAHAAANVASMSRVTHEFKILHQILHNGCYDLTHKDHDYDSFEAEDKICQRGGAVDFLFTQYGITKEQFSQPPFSPLFEKDVSNMPNTTFVVAEYDGVRNDSEAYYRHLKLQNNNIKKILLPGQTHNTIIMRDAMSDGEDPALTIANVIKGYV